VDKFNNDKTNLIDPVIRDQSDQSYINDQRRDQNGNIKDPIGQDIDDMTTRHLYINDPRYSKKLEKLADIHQKS
jgi:hypothetical protein